MKKFIKENWFKMSIVFITIIILTGLFYWYEYRPSEIKKDCHNIASASIGKGIEAFSFGQNLYEGRYQKCLRENGL